MAYDNLTNTQTSVSGTWSSSGFNYGQLTLDSSVLHIDQIQVERLFTITAVDQTKINPYDLHRIFLINKSELTLDQNSTTITAITFSGTKTYTLTTGTLAGTVITIPEVSSGQNITVRRKTYSAGTYVSWIPGSRLTSTQLNHQVNQLLKINQELIYKLESEYVRTTDLTNVNTIQFTYGQDLVMNNNKIVSLGTPVSSTDAATKGYVDTTAVNLTGTQSIGGAKTFTSNVTAPTFIGNLSGNATTATSAATVTGATQSAITSIGTLTGLTVSGNVGIGTSNPPAKITVSVTNPTNGIAGVITNSSSSSYTGAQIQLTQNTIQDWVIGQPAGVDAFAFWNGRNTSATGNERMRINSAGQVGIGTTGPSYTLDVVGTGRFANATNSTKLLIEGYGNSLAYGIQFTAANDTSTFPCRFMNAAGTLVGSIQTDASTTIFNGTVNGSVMGNIGTTIVVTLPVYATAMAATASSGFCSKPAASNVVTLPTGTWIGYATNMSNVGVISSISNIPATSGTVTCSGLSNGTSNLVNLVLMRTA